MVKKQPTHKGKIKETRTQKDAKKLKQMKKKRLIIRNLSFKISEDELKKIFSKFGEVLDVALPLTKDGKKRGFAFIQFKDAKSQIKAMKEMNFKKIHDRPIAIDFAVDKTTYQSLRNSTEPLVPVEKSNLDETISDKSADSENEDMESETDSQTDMKTASGDEEDSKVKAFFQEFDANDQMDSEKESSDESSDDDDDDDGDDEQSDSVREEVESTDSNARNKQFKKKKSEDVSEGKTVFIRNISFNITEEELREVVQEYGDIEYCLFCKDPLSEQFKGSAFVKFKEKESADKLIEESSKGPGILIDNRTLNCTYAMSREELSKQIASPKPKDRRNLNLLKCGMIAYGSKEAEGVSKTDMAKRAQLEMMKKKKLKNVNFFVSDTRLMIHNLPKNINDKDLYAMFKKAAGKNAVIKKAKVICDMKKTDAEGRPISKGFGFVSFTKHEDALRALEELNNNPRIFTSNMRPIVEFSVENKMALLTQERRREKFLNLKNKRKTDEWTTNSQSEEQTWNLKKMKGNSQQTFSHKSAKANIHHFQKMKHGKSFSPSSSTVQETKFKKKWNEKSHSTFKEPQQKDNSTSHETEKPASRKKQKKHLKGKRGKGASMNAQEKNSLSVLSSVYKEKLLNKYS